MFWKKKETKVSIDKNKIEELLRRGVDEVIVDKDLRDKLLSGKQLRIKLGIDPTSPNLHLGRSVPLLKMRDFQELGHKAVLIVGDFTGIIGDTSDKEAERPMLDRETIEENKKTYFEQVGKIIDLNKTELRYNSEWLEPLTYREIGEHADQFSLSDFIARDNIKKRLDGGKRVSLREVLYPLMVGYDSVALEADVELGGVDQRFNLLAGRTMQEHFKQPAQNIVTTTFPIEGLDGRKMSSSWGNTINFTDEPNDMFGKIMRLKDELIEKYFVILTRVSEKEIEKILEENSPRDAKARLALEIVSLYHDKEKAKKAQDNFDQVFVNKELPEDIETFVIVSGSSVRQATATIAEVSNSEAGRLINAGAVSLDGEKITDPGFKIEKEATIKIGKRKFGKLKIK